MTSSYDPMRVNGRLAVEIEALEDAEDLRAFEEAENEPTMTYEELVSRLKSDGKL